MDGGRQKVAPPEVRVENEQICVLTTLVKKARGRLQRSSIVLLLDFEAERKIHIRNAHFEMG